MQRTDLGGRGLALAGLAGLVLWGAGPARADETDQVRAAVQSLISDAAGGSAKAVGDEIDRQGFVAALAVDGAVRLLDRDGLLQSLSAKPLPKDLTLDAVVVGVYGGVAIARGKLKSGAAEPLEFSVLLSRHAADWKVNFLGCLKPGAKGAPGLAPVEATLQALARAGNAGKFDQALEHAHPKTLVIVASDPNGMPYVFAEKRALAALLALAPTGASGEVQMASPTASTDLGWAEGDVTVKLPGGMSLPFHGLFAIAKAEGEWRVIAGGVGPAPQ